MVTSVTFPPSLSFDGQTVLITGGNAGLGLEAAVHYVQLGASTVIITARNRERGTKAVADIEARTGKKGVVQLRVLDMNTFKSVHDFVAGLEKEVKAIDVVLLNAGCIHFNYETTPDGWEVDLKVNTLSTALLSLLLLPWMRAIKQVGHPQHLTVVGSGGHLKADILAKDFPKRDVLKYWNDEKNWTAQGGQPSYARSKLFIQYAMNEIAKLAIDPDGSPSPTVNVVCPGPVRTDLARHFAGKSIIHSTFVYFYTRRSLTADVGARALVMATTTSANEHGKFVRPYLTDAEYERRSAKSITSEVGKEMQATVWNEILEALKVEVPEVESIARPRL